MCVRRDALDKVVLGYTTLDEVHRIVPMTSNLAAMQSQSL